MTSLSRMRPSTLAALRLMQRTSVRCASRFEPLLLQTIGGDAKTTGRSDSVRYDPRRRFSATPPSSDGSKEEEDATPPVGRTDGGKGILASIVTPKNQFYLMIAGGGVVTYAVTRLFLGFTSFFTHLNPAVVAKYGFYTGFGTASMLGGMTVVVADNFYIRADPVFKYCLNWVQNDAAVKGALGDGITAGSLRSYRLDAGRFEMNGVTPEWRPPRIQMIFDIEGRGPPYRTGLVTCEAIKQQGFPPRLHTTLLMVDYETGNEGEGGTEEGDQTIFLRGDEEMLSRVSSRSGLSLEMLARQVHINKAVAAASTTDK